MRYAQYSTTVVYYPNHTEEQQTQPIPNPYSIHSKAVSYHQDPSGSPDIDFKHRV